MRRERRPDTRLVINKSEGTIGSGRNWRSRIPVDPVIPYPSNKVNQNMEQIESNSTKNEHNLNVIFCFKPSS